MDGRNGIGAGNGRDLEGSDGTSFEETFGRLQEMIERLEQGELQLAEAVDAFERGIELADRGTTILEAAELRVTRAMEKQQVDLDEPAI